MPAIHPNGNVLIRSHYDILEIDGLTGEIIRNINVPFTGYISDLIDISTDGTRFMACGCLVDYESGEVLRNDLPRYHVLFKNPDSDKIIFNKSNKSIRIMNLNDNSYIDYNVLPAKRSVTAIEISDNGRFFALAQIDFDDEEHTHFYLFDAQTMQFIKELEDYPANGRRIEYIQFSENAKYVGYGHDTGGGPKATFFLTEVPYTGCVLNDELTSGFHGIGFINDNYVFATLHSFQKAHSIIWDIDRNKEIFRTFDYGLSNPMYNYFFQYVLVAGSKGLVALDFEKILSTVSVKDELDTNAFRAEYSGGILTINGLESQSVEINLTINNIQGEVVFSQNIAAVHGSQISLPVSLPSGVYIARIRTGENNYSSKFLVVN